ncbi:putative ORFan [Tupanvirus deep ocean]|uniref:ORFan n=2 Tax=Tupanvirus TaxID=2094720 RepID=A0AC62A7Y3_9VIRU|nr:putative ORFan [Tupanvirus deep ocean]QKU33849.1 putative ORFan [Tupanvirus deep ocean]
MRPIIIPTAMANNIIIKYVVISDIIYILGPKYYFFDPKNLNTLKYIQKTIITNKS